MCSPSYSCHFNSNKQIKFSVFAFHNKKGLQAACIQALRGSGSKDTATRVKKSEFGHFYNRMAYPVSGQKDEPALC